MPHGLADSASHRRNCIGWRCCALANTWDPGIFTIIPVLETMRLGGTLGVAALGKGQ
jgi:hypothetical protein